MRREHGVPVTRGENAKSDNLEKVRAWKAKRAGEVEQALKSQPVTFETEKVDSVAAAEGATNAAAHSHLRRIMAQGEANLPADWADEYDEIQ